MKKIILAVILVAAAGGITYYLLQKKKQNITQQFKQEQIIGKWKLDSLSATNDSSLVIIALIGTLDSNFLKYHYDFRKEGIVVRSLDDSVQKDTARYEWTKEKQLLWKEQGDSTGNPVIVTTLTKDSLVLKAKDSTTYYFKKAK